MRERAAPIKVEIRADTERELQESIDYYKSIGYTPDTIRTDRDGGVTTTMRLKQ